MAKNSKYFAKLSHYFSNPKLSCILGGFHCVVFITAKSPTRKSRAFLLFFSLVHRTVFEQGLWSGGGRFAAAI
jgi:hypothetical protein